MRSGTDVGDIHLAEAGPQAGRGPRPAWCGDVDGRRVLEALEALDAVASISELAACLDREVDRVLPHGMVSSSFVSLAAGRCIAVKPLFAHRVAERCLEAVRPAGARQASPLIDRWLATRRPLLLDLDEMGGWPAGWFDGERPLRNLAMHAVCDVFGRSATTFCFAHLPGRLHAQHARLLRLLVPHLHTALERVSRSRMVPANGVPPFLSARQQDVLRWVQCGKTNEEVALILGMTLSNVKYHLRQAYERLNVTNRAQAAARMQELGLGSPT